MNDNKLVMNNGSNDRNLGIDLLKIVSMFMIVTLHILGHGGVLESSKPLTGSHYAAWFLEVAVYCSVNCYALVSGYIGYGRKHNYSNIFYLLLQVVFYSGLTTIAFLFFRREDVGMMDILKGAFPFAYGTYWYFSAYFCLFFFMPFFDRLVDSLERNNIIKLILTMFIVVSILPTLFHNDFPKLDSGMSFLWLTTLYILGTIIKKHRICGFNKNKYNLLGYFISVIITWLSKICIDVVTCNLLGQPKGGIYLIAFTSPIIVVASIFLTIFFLRISPKRKGFIRTIQFVTPLTFGIYLFHEEPLIRMAFVKGQFSWVSNLNPLILIPVVLAIVSAIYIVGLFIDFVRLKIFDLLKIRMICIKLDEKLQLTVFKHIHSKLDRILTYNSFDDPVFMTNNVNTEGKK